MLIKLDINRNLFSIPNSTVIYYVASVTYRQFISFITEDYIEYTPKWPAFEPTKYISNSYLFNISKQQKFAITHASN